MLPPEEMSDVGEVMMGTVATLDITSFDPGER